MNELKTWDNLIEAFHLYRNDIYTFIFYKTNKRKDLAEDITQEAFEKAWIKKEHFKGGNLKNWLIQIAINTARDSFKKNNRLVQIDNDEDLVNTESESDLYKHYIIKALSEMDIDERELVILHHILGYSHKEIAEIVQKSEGAIRVAVSRSFLKLKTIANGKLK